MSLKKWKEKKIKPCEPLKESSPIPTEDMTSSFYVMDCLKENPYLFDEPDMVNHPSHYNAYPMENLETIMGSMSEIEYRGFLKGTIEKYLYRYDLKGKPAEDLKKARFYLDELIERVEGKE